MFEAELTRYNRLNELAEPQGIVLFGGEEDINTPLGELRQAFSVESKMYNRSIANLSIQDAPAVYQACVASLAPEIVLLHIGEADTAFFCEQPAEFDRCYHRLIADIRKQNPTCRIAVVSLRNYDNKPEIEALNQHLQYIAESEQCEYGDIASKKVWNPKSSMEAAAFAYSLGFVRPLKNKRPLYDLIKILFCCEEA